MKEKTIKIMNDLSVLDDDWARSSLLPVRSMTPKKKGKFGEKIYKAYLDHFNIQNTLSDNTDYDIIADGVRTEIKFGSRTNKSKRGKFSLTFFQIRQFQIYEKLAFVCLYPDRIDIREIGKAAFMNYAASKQKQIIWAGGKEKKVGIMGDIHKNDLFHFIIPNDEWSEDFKLVYSISF